MTSPLRTLHPMRLIRRQQTYIAVAVAIYAALWAADRPVPIGSTLIYTLEFGEQRLIAGARTYTNKSSSELKAGLLADVKRFCASQLRDDATLIVISVLSSNLRLPRQNIGACSQTSDLMELEPK